MKKRIGTLKGKPIVEGDSNLVKKTEIDVSTIGNASTDDEYIYFYFPSDTFIHNTNPNTPVIIDEQTEEKVTIFNILNTICNCNCIFSTINTFKGIKTYDIANKDFTKYSDSIGYYLESDNDFYIKIPKILEKYIIGAESINPCIRGNYKKFIASLLGLTGDELDPYLISKEDWDKAVEETYKEYEQIIEL